MVGERLRPVPRQRDLPHSGGGLAFVKLQRPCRQAEQGASQRDRPGGNHQHIRAACFQRGDILGERGEPGLPQPAGLPVDQQSRADLQHDAAEGRKGGGGDWVMIRSVRSGSACRTRGQRSSHVRHGRQPSSVFGTCSCSSSALASVITAISARKASARPRPRLMRAQAVSVWQPA